MSSKELSLRDNWQTKAGKASLDSEVLVGTIFNMLSFYGYEVVRSPKDFSSAYSDYDLPDSIKEKIFNPKPAKNHGPFKWGWTPDYSIKNLKTGKKIFIELKKQNGWVKGGKPADGRGNAHERLAKHFTPGIMKAEMEKSHITDGFLPFIIIFTGNITKDPRRNSELYYWFQGHEDNYFMWRPQDNGTYIPQELQEYLQEKVLPHLD